MATLVCAPRCSSLIARTSLWAPALEAPAEVSRVFRLPSLSVRSALRWYSARLIDRPVTTKCVTGCVLFGLGDLAAQRQMRGKAGLPIDHGRTMEMAFWGGTFNSGCGHLWYNFVERIAGLPGPLGIVQRVAYDQLLWTPVADVAFFSYHALVNGRGCAGVCEELSEKLWPTLVQNWKVWPLVHCVTYCVVPLHLRVVWVGAVGVCWSTFLSYMANDFHAE